MEASLYHEPVLLAECIEALAIKSNGVYIDATFGGGGHAKAIAAQLVDGKLFAFDQDEAAVANVPPDEPRIVFIPQNFAHMSRFLRLQGVDKVDGILADLGVSWHQINTPTRGFSFRFDNDELDMRMSQVETLTAVTILNTYTEPKLVAIFKEYGELPAAHKIAAAVVHERQTRPLRTVGQLKNLTAPFVKGKPPKFYAQLFQALRMEVNRETQVLQAFLEQCSQLLRIGGRLAVISYHSIEDRLVKNYIKSGTFDGVPEKDLKGNVMFPFQAVNKKVITPTPAEIKRNPKSRSAKLRVAQKV